MKEVYGNEREAKKKDKNKELHNQYCLSNFAILIMIKLIKSLYSYSLRKIFILLLLSKMILFLSLDFELIFF